MPSSQCCLPATGLIADLNQEDRDDLSAFGTFHNAKPETVLIEEGKPHGKLFYTISGHLEARRMDNGRSVLLGSIHDGEWIGEVDLVDPSSALCSVVAVEETQYWKSHAKNWRSSSIKTRQREVCCSSVWLQRWGVGFAM